MTHLPSHGYAHGVINELAVLIETLANSHEAGVNLTRSATGPDDLRWSCGFSDPRTSGAVIYGWGKAPHLAYNEARARYELALQDVQDNRRRAEIAAIRDRHEQLIAAEIEALGPVSHTE